jgi:ABC-2 type transport system permease protein
MNDNGKEMVNISKAMTAQINHLYPLAGLYSASVIHYDIRAFIIFIIISAAAFLIYTLVVDKVFKKMNTIIMTGSSRSNYKMRSLKTSSPFKALYIKELKRFFASSLYVINTGFGIVMLTLAAIAVFFVDLDKVLGSQEVVDMVVRMSPVFIAFCTIMTCTTMVSISLEGKSFWIMKSLPIDPKTVYYAKIAVNLTVIAPAVIDVILLGIALKMDFLQILVVLLILAACAVFISFYGLLMNLLMPNFSWTSETVVIKNSASTLVTVFSAIAYVAVPLILMAIIPSSIIACLIYFTLTILLDVLLYVALMTYGKKRYYLL